METARDRPQNVAPHVYFHQLTRDSQGKKKLSVGLRRQDSSSLNYNTVKAFVTPALGVRIPTMPKLSLWPSKCRACRGQPTPPPCYQCTFNLQNPPPKYKSLPSHVRDTAHWDRSPSREETAPSFYLDDPDVLEEEQGVEQEIVAQRSFYEDEEPRGLSTLAATTQGDLSFHMLAQSLRHIALAFVPADATQPEAPTPPQRSRHRSSPAFPTTSRHDLLGRRSSGPLVPTHLVSTGNFSVWVRDKMGKPP